MRADLEYIAGVLDELETLLQNASKVPMNRGRVMVDRSDVLALAEELRDALPKELEEAKVIYREQDSVLSSAREEAGRIVEGARQRSRDLVEDSESYRRAQRMAEENLDRAEKYSREVSRGSEAYRDQVMAQLERWFGDSLDSVAESRRELEGPQEKSKQSEQPGGDQLDETQPQEPVSEDEGAGARDWRASSA